jgi:23S rRNA (cytosine1962-C5)-methyltransferase
MRLATVTALDWTDYDLLDSGDGRKLERFGPYVLDRPEVQATWQPALPASSWATAHAVFHEDDHRWKLRRAMESSWVIGYRNLRFRLQVAESRHIGVFPENAAHWDWLASHIATANRPLRGINLFGYTGLATLAAVRAGARMTHVDASRKAVAWARDNQALSGLTDRPIRWIVEDALKYLRREERRGVRYDAIILDPPAFGRGPAGEVWNLQRLFPDLVRVCQAVLSPAPLLVVATVYTREFTREALYHAMAAMMAGHRGTLEVGQLATVERSAGRVLLNALFARWNSEENT